MKVRANDRNGSKADTGEMAALGGKLKLGVGLICVGGGSGVIII